MFWLFFIGILFLGAGFTGSFQRLEDVLASLVCWLIGGLLIYLGIRKLRKNLQAKSAPAPERKLTEEEFRAAGVDYYLSNIRKLRNNNPDWKLSATQIINNGKAGKWIFQYNYVNKPVKLIPEPNNPHDKNAIAVVIAGELVGYISQGDNVHVLDILQNREIISISGFIGGGKYKEVDDDGEIYQDEISHSVTIRIKYI